MKQDDTSDYSSLQSLREISLLLLLLLLLLFIYLFCCYCFQENVINVSISLENKTVEYCSYSPETTFLNITLTNNSPSILLLTRIKIVGKEGKERVLPCYYSDNFFGMIPGLFISF
jgi:hypothetical protein